MKYPEPPPLPDGPIGRTASPPPLAAAATDSRPRDASPRAGGPAPAAESPSVPAELDGPAAGDSARIQTFLDRAQWVLADQRGMTVKAQLMLAALARELGLDEGQAAQAIRSLQQSPLADRGPIEPTAPPSPAEPAASPPRENASPQLLFRAYVGEALAKSSRDQLSPNKERRLIREGVDKLGLAEVFARQIVHEVAAAIGKHVAVAGEPESLPPAVSVGAPPEALGEFLEQAAAILTEQRGITARSRMLLTAVAGRSGLSDQQMEQALQLLQGGGGDGGTAHAWQLEREQAFGEAVRTAVTQLPHRLLTSRAENDLLDSGLQRYGLSAERTAEIVQNVARDADVRLVSADRASGHIYELAADLLAQGYTLDRPTRSRLIADAAQWGLSADQVQEILDDLLRDQQRADTVRRSLIRLAIGGAASLLGLSALLLGWSLFAGGGDPAPVQMVDIGISSERQFPPLRVSRGGEWWASDEDLLIAATKLRIVLPDLKEALRELGAADAPGRVAAYDESVRLATRQGNVRLHGSLLREFFAGCLVIDPSDAAAVALAEALLGQIPAVGESLPEDDAEYELPFWATRTVSAALARPELSEERAVLLAKTLAAAVGATVDRRQEPREMERRYVGALCQHLYSVIIAAAPTQPQAASPFHVTVTRHASRWLDASYVELRTLDLLAAVLPSSGDAWREYEYLLQFAINSTDPLVVLRIVDLYEQVSDPALRDFLADRLLRRAGIYPHVSGTDDVTRRVRESLGAKHLVSGRQRWNHLAQLVEQLHAADQGTSPDQRLQQIAEAAHAATLACSLAHGDLGYATFDELRKSGAPRLARSDALPASRAREAPRQRQISTSLYQSILANIQQLNDTRNRRREHIPIYLRNLAAVAPQLPELPSEHAEQLARYLLAQKTDQEHQAVLQHAEALTRWRTVRLALMDQVLQTTADKQRVAEVVSLVVRRDLSGGEGGSWRDRLRDALLRGLIDELALAAPRVPSGQRIYDDLSEALRELYITQARVLGVPADRYTATATPADILALIAETYAAAAGSAAGSLSPAASQPSSWTAQLAALEYAADNDLQRTVLLQRLWLKVLAAGLAQRGKIQPGQGDHLLAALQESDRQAVDSIAQLFFGEQTLLHVWLLTQPAQ